MALLVVDTFGEPEIKDFRAIIPWSASLRFLNDFIDGRTFHLGLMTIAERLRLEEVDPLRLLQNNAVSEFSWGLVLPGCQKIAVDKVLILAVSKPYRFNATSR